jgi:hypothetical protein
MAAIAEIAADSWVHETLIVLYLERAICQKPGQQVPTRQQFLKDQQ